MNRIDIVVDLETLGTRSNAPIFQIGAIAINIKTGEEYGYFNGLCDFQTLENIDGGTLKWWLKTNHELFAQLCQQGEDNKLSAKDLISSFVAWIESMQNDVGVDNVYLWGNGILFDNCILRANCEKYKINYPIIYRNDRDLRTIYELAANKIGVADGYTFRETVKINEERIEHDGLSDARHEAKALIAAEEIIRGTNNVQGVS